MRLTNLINSIICQCIGNTIYFLTWSNSNLKAHPNRYTVYDNTGGLIGYFISFNQELKQFPPRIIHWHDVQCEYYHNDIYRFILS